MNNTEAVSIDLSTIRWFLGSLVSIFGIAMLAVWRTSRLSKRLEDQAEDFPRVQKVVEGDTEEHHDSLVRKGLVGQFTDFRHEFDLHKKTTLDNARFIKVWCRVKGIPLDSGEFKFEQDIRRALAEDEGRQHDSEAVRRRRSVLDEQAERFDPPEHVGGAGYQTDRFGTPTPLPPPPAKVPRPAFVPKDTETPPPPTNVLPKGGRLLTPPPFDSRHMNLPKLPPRKGGQDK